MRDSIEAQLATAWDMATNQLEKQQKEIEELKAGLAEERGPRAKMAAARHAANAQIHKNALDEVVTMVAADPLDRDGIAERLDRVTAFLAGLAELPDEPEPKAEDKPEAATKTELKASPKAKSKTKAITAGSRM